MPASTVIHSADIHSSFCLKAMTAVRCKDASHIWGERDVCAGPCEDGGKIVQSPYVCVKTRAELHTMP